jgi:hypothetical protein
MACLFTFRFPPYKKKERKKRKTLYKNIDQHFFTTKVTLSFSRGQQRANRKLLMPSQTKQVAELQNAELNKRST